MLEKMFGIDNLGLFFNRESLSQLRSSTLCYLGNHEIEIGIRQERSLILGNSKSKQ